MINLVNNLWEGLSEIPELLFVLYFKLGWTSALFLLFFAFYLLTAWISRDESTLEAKIAREVQAHKDEVKNLRRYSKK